MISDQPGMISVPKDMISAERDVISPATPYVGLRPFTEKETTIFFGRKRDTEALVNRIYASRTVVVFAPSGVGKTSLLRAGVNADLASDEAMYPVYINDWTKPCVEQVSQALRAFLARRTPARPNGNGEDTPASTSLLGLAKEFRTQTNILPVFILDQFEEVLRYHNNRDLIWDQLAPLMNALSQPARVVLSLREDYLGILDELMNRVPGLMENRYRVQPLSIDAIKEAIREPLAKLDPPFEIEPGLVDRIVEDFEARRKDTASDDRVEAGYLQLVCQRLWDIEKGNPARCLQLSTYEKEGGIDRIVESHIQRSLKDLLDLDQQHLLYAMTRYLVTPTGAKLALSADDLSDYIGEHDFSVAGRSFLAGLPARRPGTAPLKNEFGVKYIQTVADKLCGTSILILRRKTFRDRTTYELCHDVLGTVLLRWRARIAEEEAVAAQKQAEEAERQKKLALAEAENARLLVKEGQEEIERKLEEAREKWLGTTVALAGYVFAVGGGIAWFWFSNKAGVQAAWVVFFEFWVTGSILTLALRACLRRKRTIGKAILRFQRSILQILPRPKWRPKWRLPWWSSLVCAGILAVAAGTTCFFSIRFLFSLPWAAGEWAQGRFTFAFGIWPDITALNFPVLLLVLAVSLTSIGWLISIWVGLRLAWRTKKWWRYCLFLLFGLSAGRMVWGLIEGEASGGRYFVPLKGMLDALFLILFRHGGTIWLVVLLVMAAIRRRKAAKETPPLATTASPPSAHVPG
jgi:hypothetical protein